MDANNIKLGVDTKCSGTVAVANDVVAIIASLAASEVEGVSSMFGNITNELMSMVGMKNLTKGVRVSVLNHTVTIDLYIVLDYGYPIPDTCRKAPVSPGTALAPHSSASRICCPVTLMTLTAFPHGNTFRISP